jgi:hypothetical protein
MYHGQKSKKSVMETGRKLCKVAAIPAAIPLCLYYLFIVVFLVNVNTSMFADAYGHVFLNLANHKRSRHSIDLLIQIGLSILL